MKQHRFSPIAAPLRPFSLYDNHARQAAPQKKFAPPTKSLVKISAGWFASAHRQFPFCIRNLTGTLVHNRLELPDFSLIFALLGHILKTLKLI
ncbi:MAG: hypothetical protein NTW80_07415 [Deltaproteobacteria bacterium]|nr:hypothetical protein [Deltaproteobacteria bacterium]